MFNFIIAIRHPSTVADKQKQLKHLTITLESINSQTNQDFKVFIVGNCGQQLPLLPPRFHFIEVNFPPPQEKKFYSHVDEYYNMIRWDKGRRISQAISIIPSNEYVMVVDDDDLVSNKIVEFVLSHNQQCGWYVKKGYSLDDETKRIRLLDHFQNICGTSIIVPCNYYAYKNTASESDIPEVGSHKLITQRYKLNKEILPLPFRAAIYRMGHSNASQVVVNNIKQTTYSTTNNKHLTLKQLFIYTKMHSLKKEFFSDNDKFC